MIENRLRKNLKKIKKFTQNSKITAYRIYNKDIPEYPYLIDIYNEYAVIYEKGKRLDDSDESQNLREQKKSEILLALKSIFELSENNIIFKERKIQNNKNDQYTKNDNLKEMIVVQEEERQYYINLYDYLDTGLFLDHRWLRRIVQKESNRKYCLNLFAYTGSISVAMKKGGAKRVITVDLSKTYLKWAKENFKLNELAYIDQDFIHSDVFSYLKEDHDYFDIIVCDPPTFSNSKRLTSEFDVQRDHIGLINLCMKNLSRDGKLYFSTNLRKFKMSSEIAEKFNVKDISGKSLDMDFNQNTKRFLFEITFIQ